MKIAQLLPAVLWATCFLAAPSRSVCDELPAWVVKAWNNVQSPYETGFLPATNFSERVRYPSVAEWPTNQETRILLVRALETAEREDSFVRREIAARRVNAVTWNLMCSGTLTNPGASGVVYRVFLKPGGLGCQQVDKEFLLPNKDRDGCRSLQLLYLDMATDNLTFLSVANGDELLSLSFWPETRPKEFRFRVKNGLMLVACWDEQGRLRKEEVVNSSAPKSWRLTPVSPSARRSCSP